MEEDIDDFIGVKGKEIHEALEELRKNEIKFKVGELKARLPQVGRCIICTLRLPCKHFTSLSQMPRPAEPELNPTYTSATFNVTDYLPKLTPESHKRGFSVKYKGTRTVYNFDFNRRHTSLPNEKRLKQLEIIESYREEKLKQEIQKINLAKEEEIAKKEKERLVEEKRKLRMVQQKAKISQYKLDLAEKNNQIQEFLKKELDRKKKQDEQYQEYIQDLKERLSEYHAKKDLLKKISIQKVSELQQEAINYKPIKIKHLYK
jgi:hypothetical protein